MYLAHKGTEIPTRWKHDPSLYDSVGWNVAIHLQHHHMDVSLFWNLTKQEFERLYKSK